ncbi:hypothetical protein [Neobacillus sp. LXY-1]|uniref:hypothetical protein n=1 Tax=Neobacillus sp. LXY-1 TaxID=3379133 RepID=UPI003EE343EE
MKKVQAGRYNSFLEGYFIQYIEFKKRRISKLLQMGKKGETTKSSITLKEITSENFFQCVFLKSEESDQYRLFEENVASNAFSIA